MVKCSLQLTTWQQQSNCLTASSTRKLNMRFCWLLYWYFVIFSTCDHELWLIFLTFELYLDSFRMSHHAKCRRLFRSQAVFWTHIQTDRHTRSATIALPWPPKVVGKCLNFFSSCPSSCLMNVCVDVLCRWACRSGWVCCVWTSTSTTCWQKASAASRRWQTSPGRTSKTSAFTN